MNIYNGLAWMVETGQVCGLSDVDRDTALPLRMDDRIRGERNHAFMAQCREIATARLGQPQAVGGCCGRTVGPFGWKPRGHAGSSDHERFMRRAIALARRGATAGDGGPFGALIVLGGGIIEEGWNRVIATQGPTAHGEMVAIRDACRRIGNNGLQGCVLYTSGEPCPMCLGAIYWARIERVFYGFSIQDAAGIGFDDHFIYEQLARPAEQRVIPEIPLLRAEALKILEAFAADPGRVRY